MPKSMISAFLLCALVVGAAGAQEIVHAVSGTVMKVDPQAKTLRIKTNDGTEGLFTVTSKPGMQVSLDRDIKDHTTDAATFNKAADTVVVFYYGNADTRSAVAVQDLGPGPFTKVEGTVTKWNRHQQMLTLKDTSGKEHTFHIDPKAVAETMDGAVPGNRLDPQKGSDALVLASTGSGTPAALYIRD